MRKDSCCIIALSLNLEQKVHPIIWSLSNLPFDCCQLFAVPKPTGEQASSSIQFGVHGGRAVSVLDCQSRGLGFKSRPGQKFGLRFLCPLANSAMMSTLTVRCQWEDETLRERGLVIVHVAAVSAGPEDDDVQWLWLILCCCKSLIEVVRSSGR